MTPSKDTFGNSICIQLTIGKHIYGNQNAKVTLK